MSKVTFPLVEDAELRASLRRLYPEYTPTVQAILIAEPGAPLPDLVDYSLPVFTSATKRAQSLEHALKLLQTRHPEMTWVSRDLSGEPELSLHSDKDRDIHEVLTTLPDGAVTRYSHTLRKGHATHLSLTGQGGIIRLATAGWLQVLEGDHMSLGIDKAGARDRLIYAEECVEVLADGSPQTLCVDHDRSLAPVRGRSPYAPLPVRARAQQDNQDVSLLPSAREIRHWDAARARLVQRWEALADPADRARITSFWLGHPHPILAAAGLATLHVVPRLTP
jgi:hypothetical protein